MNSERSSWVKDWFQVAFRWRGSVAPKVLPGVFLCGGFSFLISVLYYFEIPVTWEGVDSIITNVTYNFVLGLLLVFRTNTAYDRFWEGRKAWAILISNARSLASLLWVSVGETGVEDRNNKIVTLRLIPAFVISTKLHLQQEPINGAIAETLSSSQLLKLTDTSLIPLQLSIWIGEYLQQQYDRKLVNANQLTAMNGLVNSLLDGVTNCERILQTPIPVAYSIYLKRLILIYFIALPFHLVGRLQWWTGFVAMILGFIVLGLEEIASEIENPFGKDANDLPLDDFCATVTLNLESLVSLNNEHDQNQLNDRVNAISTAII